MEIYLAILEDRHSDVQIEVFTKVIKALKQITEWQAGYGKEVWEEDEDSEWEYYVHSDCDDGPSMRIERKELK